MNEEDIVVRANPALEQFMSAVRTLLIALGAWATGRGYLEEDTVAAVLTVSIVVGPFLYGQFKLRRVLTQRNTLVSSSRKASFK